MTSRRVILHESTQRSLCHLGFVAFGLAPLLVCIYFAIAACLPGYHQRQAATWARELEKNFGLAFRIGEAHALAPFRVRLEEVEILSPTTQQLIGKIRSVHMTEQTNGGWMIRLDSPEIQIDQLADGCQIAHQFQRRQSSLSQASIECERLSISDQDRTLELAAFSAAINPEPNQSLTAKFKILPPSAQKSVNQQSVPESQLVVKKQGALTQLEILVPEASPAPCLAISKLLDLTGSDAWTANSLAIQSSQFSGKIRVAFHDQKTNYSLENARISNIDLAQLALGRETLVSGTAELTNFNVTTNSKQLESASGHIEVSPGYMDSRFLQSLEFYLGFSLQRKPSIGLVGFHRTSINFAIHPRVFHVVGGLEDSQGVLALRMDRSALPIISLVHALAFNPENPMIPGTISPMVKQALVWLPLDDMDRRQLASRQQQQR